MKYLFSLPLLLAAATALGQQVTVAAKATIPVYFVQAENDFSIKPSVELSAYMKEKGKKAAVKIYPPHGTTAADGHALIEDYSIWGPDVFPVLERWLKQ